MNKTGSKTKLNKTKTSSTKTNKFNKKLTLKDTIMDSDDEYDASTVVSPKMFDFISKPEKMKSCGEVFITMILRLEEIYDTDRNELCKALVNYNFEDYQKFLKSQKRIANKRTKAKENKFIPTDEKGIKLKKTNMRSEFMKEICKIRTKKDEKNKSYFKDAKFNNMTYINVEWVKFKEKGIDYFKLDQKGNKIKGLYNKIHKRVEDVNSVFNKEFEKQKPPKKPNTRWSGYFIFADDFRKKNQDKPKYKEFRGIKFISIIGEKWKKLSSEQQEEYNKKAKALNKENRKKLVIWEKEMENRKLELIKKTEGKLGKGAEIVTDSSDHISEADADADADAEDDVDNSNNVYDNDTESDSDDSDNNDSDTNDNEDDAEADEADEVDDDGSASENEDNSGNTTDSDSDSD